VSGLCIVLRASLTRTRARARSVDEQHNIRVSGFRRGPFGERGMMEVCSRVGDLVISINDAE
jgi:hypothetical protein